MNRDQFIKYLEDPFLMDSTSISELNEIIQEYPYFQTAHMLYAKVLHDQNNIKYDNQLKLTAAYATDREILFKLINSKPKAQEEVVKDIETVEEVIINDKTEEETVELEPQQEVVEDIIETEKEEVVEEVNTEEVIEEISLPEVVDEDLIKEETVEEIPQEEIIKVKAEIPAEPEVSDEIKEEVEEPVVEEKKESIADQILRKVKAIKEAKAAGKEKSEKSIADQILEKYSREDKKVEETVEANIEEQEVFVEDKIDEQIVEEHKEEDVIQTNDIASEDVKEELPVVEDYLTIEDLSNDVSDEIPDLSGLAAEISTQSEEENVLQPEEIQSKQITEDDDLLSFEIIEDKEEIEAIEIVSEKPEGVVVSGEDEVFELEGYTQEVAEENVESYSFEKWLKLLEENKSDKSREQIQESKKIDKDENQEIDLIDKFISQDHKIKSKPAEKVSKSDFANKEEASEEGFMTETLANIYIKQKYYKKAISAYEKLSLKYPKKNAYFASQIEKIKEIINQQE